MARVDTVVLDVGLLKRTTCARGLLRGDVAKRAGLSAGPVTAAFKGLPIGVPSARKIARVIRVKLCALIRSEEAQDKAAEVAA